MRKYQQLLLLTLSLSSIIVLLVYKTENRRLRQVLNVVNFFGRNATNTEDLRSQTNIEDLFSNTLLPMPVWQVIAPGFHAYSSHWRSAVNTTTTNYADNGEAMTIVVGDRNALVNFQCSLHYKRNKMKMEKGKFRFQRYFRGENDDKLPFIQYNFFCRSASKTTDDPDYVAFSYINRKPANNYPLKLRSIRPLTSTANVKPLTICLDLIQTPYDDHDAFARHEDRIMQFLLHHYLQGVNNFLVYNGGELTARIIRKLHQLGVYLMLLPFNFPFSMEGNIDTLSVIREIILDDCLIRNFGLAKYTILLNANEFLFSNGNLGKQSGNGDLISYLKIHSQQSTRGQLSSLPICMDAAQKLLTNNTHYYAEDADNLNDRFVDIPRMLVYQINNDLKKNNIVVPKSIGLIHRYVDCTARGATDDLHDWQLSLRQDFMQYVQRIRKEMQLLI